MSDSWTFSSSSPPPLSSPSSFRNHGNPVGLHLPPPQVTSPHQQVSSPHPHVSSPHLPHHQVASSHHLPHQQVSSPHHLPHQQVSSPHHLPHQQVSSPHHLPLHQVSSPHHHVSSPHLPHHQVTSPHHLPHQQVSSPHHHVSSPHLSHHQVSSPHHHLSSPQLPHHQVTSPHHFPHHQVTSPHPQITSPHILPQAQILSPHPQSPQVTSPHFFPQSQVTSPHYVPQSTNLTSPHVLAPAPHLLSRQNDAPPELSCLLSSDTYSFQNQNTTDINLQDQNHNQNQNQFNPDVTYPRDVLEDSHQLQYNTHPLLTSGVYGQGDTSGPGQVNWGPVDPTLSQIQCSPLGSLSGGMAPGRWNSMEFSSSTEDFSSTQQFFPDSNNPQSFCSPTTPGPSPHYPQTPTMCSPSPQVQPRKDRLGFHTQTSTQLSRDQSLSCGLRGSDSYNLTSEPNQHQNRLLPSQSQSQPIQDQSSLFTASATSSSETSFSPQGGDQRVGSAAQSQSLAAGLMWREEGGGGGDGGGGDGQPDWTWMKRPQPENKMKVLDSRLLCSVCNRDFRSLPALNGHMRSHSGFRTNTCLKKSEDSSPPVQTSVSMVMPVSVPVQSRGASRVCGQRRCSRLSPTSRGAVLYRSLMRQDNDGGGEAVVDGGRGHYTPPPMLCPLRVGPGLYCSLNTRRQQRVQTVQLHNTQNGLSGHVAMETLTTGINKPQINVGQSFQAEIPPLCHQKYARSDSQDSLLLWTPCDELEKPVNKQRVEALLTMARSSVVPRGGACPEHALHVLSENRGDFLLTVEKLLSTPETSNNLKGVSWSAAETKLLVKSLQLHHKDFSRAQRAVQTKSLSQCVEFYYLWKRKLSLSAKTPAGLTVTLPNTNGQRSSRSQDAS